MRTLVGQAGILRQTVTTKGGGFLYLPEVCAIQRAYARFLLCEPWFTWREPWITIPMLNVRTTEVFDAWFSSLRDRIAKRRIQARIDRLSVGNPGDINSAGSPVVELRIDHGPGYRVYYVKRGDVLVILLCGGDKSTQARDIKAAHAMVPYLDLE